MQTRRHLVQVRSLTAMALLLATGPALQRAEAQIAPSSGSGLVIVAPYVWMSGISGETGVRDLTADVDVQFTEVLSHLRFAAMAAVEGGYGPWVGGVDAMYTSLEVDRLASVGPAQLELEMKQKVLISNVFAGYSFRPHSVFAIDVLAGARIWMVDAGLKVSGEGVSAERSRDPKWVDALGGFRVRWQVAERWQLSAVGDVGGGGSESTAGVLATALYLVSSRWAVFASYRDIDVNYRKNDYFFDGRFTGPVIGVVYRL